MAGARQIVDLPAFAALPYGLWDVAQHPTPSGPHWQQGITYQQRCPTAAATYDECLTVTGTGAPPAPAPKTDNVDQELRGATPFTVYAEFDCSPVGLNDAATAAADALARVEQRQVEAVFWTGTAGGRTVAFPHLAAAAEVEDASGIVLQTAASTAVTGADVAHGLGALEQDLADCYGGQGVIHIPLRALATFAAWGLVRDVDGQLLTPAGNLVAVGGGYTGTGPDGSAPAAGTAWIYATGKVFGYRSEVYLTAPRDSLDRAENTQRMIAERTYVLAYECCHLAAHITLGVAAE